MLCDPSVTYLGRALPIYYSGYLVGLSVKLWVIILANILAELSMSAETELILFKCFIILCYLELTSIFTQFSIGERLGVFLCLGITNSAAINTLKSSFSADV